MAGSDKTPSQHDDDLAARSLSRVPRVPLIVGSTLLLGLLTFLTVLATRQGDAATRPSRSPAAPTPSGTHASEPAPAAPRVEPPSPARDTSTAATAAERTADPEVSTQADASRPALGPAQVGVRRPPMTAGPPADSTPLAAPQQPAP